MAAADLDVSHYVPHLPVGERCSHARIYDDGRPDNEWDTRGVPEFYSEMTDLMNNDLDPRLTYAQHLDYIAALKILMHKAVSGTVAFRDDGGEGRALRQTIVELRPKLSSRRPPFGKASNPPALLRLYLGEPDIDARKLLGLSVAVKEFGPEGLPEQDVHIDVAIQRADDWASN